MKNEGATKKSFRVLRRNVTSIGSCFTLFHIYYNFNMVATREAVYLT